MALARVYNDHPQYGNKEYVEKFRDDIVKIPIMGHVEFADASEGHMFIGQYVPIRKYDNGELINPKALRIVVFHPCGTCKQEFLSVDLLKAHMKDTHLVNYQTQVVHRCNVCKDEFDTEQELLVHGVDAHQELLADPDIKAKRKPRAANDHSASPRGSEK